ncbi:MAG: hypothetical protein M1281_04665 [Chloroflexi bacterium]|nr:hypothetical protein [Chloroflexota bacterium]
MTNEAGGLNETELSLELTHNKGFPKLVRYDYFDEDGSKSVLMIAPKSPVDKS